MGKIKFEQTPPIKQLTPFERETLLVLARQSIENSLQGLPLVSLDYERLTDRLREKGTTFVTLTIAGQLRGCVGGLEAVLPLVEDARNHAVAAAVKDFRFYPLSLAELPRVRIEISCLSAFKPLTYSCPEELLDALTPGVDGVVLREGKKRSTFLPQVWERIPDKVEFLGLLCNKLGYPADFWRSKRLEILTYQVESFHEE